MYLATTDTANLVANGGNLSSFIFFAGLAGLAVATAVHLVGAVLQKDRMLRMIQAFGSGLVVTIVISLVTSAVAGRNGQTSIAQALVAAAGLSTSSVVGLSQTSLQAWIEGAP